MKNLKILIFSMAALTMLVLAGCNQGPAVKSPKKSDEPLVSEKTRIQQHNAYQVNINRNNTNTTFN